MRRRPTARQPRAIGCADPTRRDCPRRRSGVRGQGDRQEPRGRGRPPHPRLAAGRDRSRIRRRPGSGRSRPSRRPRRLEPRASRSMASRSARGTASSPRASVRFPSRSGCYPTRASWRSLPARPEASRSAPRRPTSSTRSTAGSAPASAGGLSRATLPAGSSSQPAACWSPASPSHAVWARRCRDTRTLSTRSARMPGRETAHRGSSRPSSVTKASAARATGSVAADWPGSTCRRLRRPGSASRRSQWRSAPGLRARREEQHRPPTSEGSKRSRNGFKRRCEGVGQPLARRSKRRRQAARLTGRLQGCRCFSASPAGKLTSTWRPPWVVGVG